MDSFGRNTFAAGHLPVVQVALRCVAHPVSLTCVAVLLLNDHLLKELSPGWITGKLSDLAGLFFFPFLLALPPALLRPRADARAIGGIAIAITALWFTLAKVTSAGNRLTADLVELALGARPIIVLDPTDLLALLSLIPAWLLWRRTAREPRGAVSLRLVAPALLIASFAVMATSMRPVEGVAAVGVVGGELYAYISGGSGKLFFSSRWDYLYRSSDNGRTWSEVDEDAMPDGMYDSIIEVVQRYDSGGDAILTQWNSGDSLPAYNEDSLWHVRQSLKHIVMVRPRDHGLTQYHARRASGSVERSDDGGVTWRTIWEAPAEQRDRLAPSYRFGPMGPLDMTLTPDSAGTVVVAMGPLGVLVIDSVGHATQHVAGEGFGPSFTPDN